jgi:hypothetical protein
MTTAAPTQTTPPDGTAGLRHGRAAAGPTVAIRSLATALLAAALCFGVPAASGAQTPDDMPCVADPTPECLTRAAVDAFIVADDPGVWRHSGRINQMLPRLIAQTGQLDLLSPYLAAMALHADDLVPRTVGLVAGDLATSGDYPSASALLREHWQDLDISSDSLYFAGIVLAEKGSPEGISWLIELAHELMDGSSTTDRMSGAFVFTLRNMLEPAEFIRALRHSGLESCPQTTFGKQVALRAWTLARMIEPTDITLLTKLALCPDEPWSLGPIALSSLGLWEAPYHFNDDPIALELRTAIANGLIDGMDGLIDGINGGDDYRSLSIHASLLSLYPADEMSEIMERWFASLPNLGAWSKARVKRIVAALETDDAAGLRNLMAHRPGVMDKSLRFNVGGIMAVFAAAQGDDALLNFIFENWLSLSRWESVWAPEPVLLECEEPAVVTDVKRLGIRLFAQAKTPESAFRLIEDHLCPNQRPVALYEIAVQADELELRQAALASAYRLEKPSLIAVSIAAIAQLSVRPIR